MNIYDIGNMLESAFIITILLLGIDRIHLIKEYPPPFYGFRIFIYTIANIVIGIEFNDIIETLVSLSFNTFIYAITLALTIIIYVGVVTRWADYFVKYVKFKLNKH